MAFFLGLDKENAHVDVLHPVRTGGITAPRGKAFQSNKTPRSVATPLAQLHAGKNKQSFLTPTPRKALGDVRNTLGSAVASKPASFSLKKPAVKPAVQQKLAFGLQPPKPSTKSTSRLKPGLKENRVKSQKCETKQQVQTKEVPLEMKPWFMDDIEHMHICEEEDDYEDLWPKCERPATYLNQLLHWRPERIIPFEDARDDDHTFAYSDEEEDEWMPKISDLTLEEPDMKGSSPITLDLDDQALAELALPTLDDLVFDDCIKQVAS